MTKSDKLLNYIKQSNYSLDTMAKLLKISKSCLINKINCKKDFEAKEIIEIARILEMNKDEMLSIFFDWK